MREIKFRAWAVKWWNMPKGMKGVMLHDIQNTNWSCHEVDGSFGDYINPDPGEEYEVMQYTGLKDRNGVEIYEGDVVKWDEYDTTGDYSIKAGIAPVVFDEWACFDFDPAYELSADLSLVANLGKCEVIGNIYENPELLQIVGGGE